MLFQAVESQPANTTLTTTARSNGKKPRDEGEKHPFQPLLSMQREGHVEINICSSENAELLGILIKRLRLLKTLLLRAHLQQAVLLFTLNSDELSQFHPHTSTEPWSTEGWRLRRKEKINMKCQARGQIELVFPAARSWGLCCSSRTKGGVHQRRSALRTSQENGFCSLLN